VIKPLLLLISFHVLAWAIVCVTVFVSRLVLKSKK
jgi:hypothetical protein